MIFAMQLKTQFNKRIGMNARALVVGIVFVVGFVVGFVVIGVIGVSGVIGVVVVGVVVVGVAVFVLVVAAFATANLSDCRRESNSFMCL